MWGGTLCGSGRTLAYLAMPLQVLPAHDWLNLIRTVNVCKTGSSVLGRANGAVLAHIAKQFKAGACLLLPQMRHNDCSNVRALARVPSDLSRGFGRPKLRFDQFAYLDELGADGSCTSCRNRLLPVCPRRPSWIAPDRCALRYTKDGACGRSSVYRLTTTPTKG